MSGNGRMVRHIEFRPPDDLRLYEIPESGVLRLDDEVLVAEVGIAGAVVRHYGFASRWLAVTLTTDHTGQPADLAGLEIFAHTAKCDIATPMQRDGDTCWQTDLWLDVLVRANGRDHLVEDEDEFDRARDEGLLSGREADQALDAFRDVLAMVRAGTLLDLLATIWPFGSGHPPPARPFRRLRTSDLPSVRPGVRPTW